MLTPRSLWHDCDHEHSYSHETKIEKDDCFACDFGLGFIDNTKGASFQIPLQKIALVNVSVESFVSDQHFNLFSHRGPPQV